MSASILADFATISERREGVEARVIDERVDTYDVG